MKINEFSEKYGIKYASVYNALNEAGILIKWKKNHDYIEPKMVDAVIEYYTRKKQGYVLNARVCQDRINKINRRKDRED